MKDVRLTLGGLASCYMSN